MENRRGGLEVEEGKTDENMKYEVSRRRKRREKNSWKMGSRKKGEEVNKIRIHTGIIEMVKQEIGEEEIEKGELKEEKKTEVIRKCRNKKKGGGRKGSEWRLKEKRRTEKIIRITSKKREGETGEKGREGVKRRGEE